MEGVGTAIAGIASAVIGLAIIAVLVSQNAQTSNVIQSAASGFGSIIGAAVSPVSNSGGTLASWGAGMQDFSAGATGVH